MTAAPLRLRLHSGTLSIVRLDAGAELPVQLDGVSFSAVTRTDAELSVVAPSEALAGLGGDGPWRRLEIAGPLDLDEIGVLLRIAAPLARSEVSVFAISSHDTDHVLVREEQLQAALEALVGAGLEISDTSPVEAGGGSRPESLFVDGAELPWRPSPYAGVSWKKLHHDATTGESAVLLRFEPGAAYGAHRHPAGEEYLVLEGSLEDGTHSYGPGTYVRHAAGSAHRPRSLSGCVVFVRLARPVEILEKPQNGGDTPSDDD